MWTIQKEGKGVNLKIPLIFLSLFLSDSVANTLSSSRAQFGGWTRNTIHSSYAKRVTQILLPSDVSDTLFFPFFSGKRCRCIQGPLGEVFFPKKRKDAISPFPLQRQSALTRKIRRRREKKAFMGKWRRRGEILPFFPSSSPEVFPRDICPHSEKKCFHESRLFLYFFLWERRSIMTRIVRKKAWSHFLVR